MTNVTLRNHDVTLEATPVNDTYTDQAIEHARGLLAEGIDFDKALVDRFDGLVLTGRHGTWHFQTPLCGYDGTGPNTTATILAMFNFGSHADIMSQINHRDNAAKATLYR